jgi:hypothetical protein
MTDDVLADLGRGPSRQHILLPNDPLHYWFEPGGVYWADLAERHRVRDLQAMRAIVEAEDER